MIYGQPNKPWTEDDWPLSAVEYGAVLARLPSLQRLHVHRPVSNSTFGWSIGNGLRRRKTLKHLHFCLPLSSDRFVNASAGLQALQAECPLALAQGLDLEVLILDSVPSHAATTEAEPLLTQGGDLRSRCLVLTNIRARRRGATDSIPYMKWLGRIAQPPPVTLRTEHVTRASLRQALTAWGSGLKVLKLERTYPYGERGPERLNTSDIEHMRKHCTRLESLSVSIMPIGTSVLAAMPASITPLGLRWEDLTIDAAKRSPAHHESPHWALLNWLPSTLIRDINIGDTSGCASWQELDESDEMPFGEVKLVLARYHPDAILLDAACRKRGVRVHPTSLAQQVENVQDLVRRSEEHLAHFQAAAEADVNEQIAGGADGGENMFANAAIDAQ